MFTFQLLLFSGLQSNPLLFNPSISHIFNQNKPTDTIHQTCLDNDEQLLLSSTERNNTLINN